MNHPPGTEMVEEAHHLPRGVVDVDRAVQNHQLRLQNGLGQGLQLLIMGAMAQLRLKAGEAAQTGPVKVPGQEEFPHFSAHLPGQLPGGGAGAAHMVLPVNDHDFHAPLSFSRKSRRYWEGGMPSAFLKTLVNTR